MTTQPIHGTKTPQCALWKANGKTKARPASTIIDILRARSPAEPLMLSAGSSTKVWIRACSRPLPATPGAGAKSDWAQRMASDATAAHDRGPLRKP